MRIEFDTSRLGSEDKGRLDALREAHTQISQEYLQVWEVPEPGPRLDVGSRPTDERKFKHLHQMCFFQFLNFITSNRIKFLYLIDAYLSQLASANPIGLYSAARGLLEFNAFTHRVRGELDAIQSDNPSQWRTRGEKYFSTIQRARYGTSSPIKREHLESLGVSPKRLKPLNISDCIARLREEAGFEDVGERYDLLCDYVHHNLSSQTTGITALTRGTVVNTPGGGQALIPKGIGIISYKYGAPQAVERAVSVTASGALDDTRGVFRWLNGIPESAFTPEETHRHLGSMSGLRGVTPTEVGDAGVIVGAPAVGRNEPCPCGGGKKFKKCHGKR